MKKATRILYESLKRYVSKSKNLLPIQKQELEGMFHRLHEAIQSKNKKLAKQLAATLSGNTNTFLPKTPWSHAKTFCTSILPIIICIFALRQLWLEPFVIPTGSMRPTLKERDFLLVSKTDFGVNQLTSTSHLYFDPDQVTRGTIAVFSGLNMDIPDLDTKHFGIIPGKKSFVKRLVGKPGDTLYFYGGQIYGIDANGQSINEFRESAWGKTLEHIPFLRFEGKVQGANRPFHSPSSPVTAYSPITLYQMNEPVAKLTHLNGFVIGTMTAPYRDMQYFDLWGFNHYAMARLLTAEELRQIHPELNGLPVEPLYLELIHHPSIQKSQLARDLSGRLRPHLKTTSSLLPLSSGHIERLMRHMTTVRFVVKNGVAYRYGSSPYASSPRLEGVPDGTYEIQNGEACRVYWFGYTKKLPSTHPLLKHDPAHVQTLYNLGVEFDTRYAPAAYSILLPSRYAYFRNGDLYTLGSPLLHREDPSLIAFVENEEASLTPFVDAGPPTTEQIRKYGITVPKAMYLMLGDNHAVSADSRHFGFVPQDNLRGVPRLRTFPINARWGSLPQPAWHFTSLQNLSITALVILVLALPGLYRRWWLRRWFQQNKKEAETSTTHLMNPLHVIPESDKTLKDTVEITTSTTIQEHSEQKEQ